MRRTKIAATCVVALLTTCALAAANASAALPEFGRCTKVEGVMEGKKTVYHGDYKSANCIKPSPGKTGKYEWLAGPGAEPKWTGFSENPESVTLETVGHAKVKCGEAILEGEYTGPKTETVKLELSECESPALHEPCQDAGAEFAGEIVAESLEGEIGFISDGAKPSVGLDLKHSPDIAAFECGTLPEIAATGVVEGSVIAPLTRIDYMTKQFRLKFKAPEGKQVPQSFEGAAKDTLTTTLLVGLSRTVEESGLTAHVELEDDNVSSGGATEGPGEPIEIKAE
jgi:hypothetical protein